MMTSLTCGLKSRRKFSHLMSAMTPADSCMKKQTEECLALIFQPLLINYTKETPKTIKPVIK